MNRSKDKTNDSPRGNAPLLALLVIGCALTLGIAAFFKPASRTGSEESAESTVAKTERASTSVDSSSPEIVESNSSTPNFDASREQKARFEARAQANKRKEEQEAQQLYWSDLLQRHADGDKEAFNEFLSSVTQANSLTALKALKGVKLSRADQSRFYEKLGKLGGQGMMDQLMQLSDRNAALAMKGWAQMDSSAASAWLRQLDVYGDQGIQDYLAAANLDEHGFLDTLSEGMLESLKTSTDANDPAAFAAFEEKAIELVEFMMNEDPLKGEAMMRELTEELVKNHDPESLAQWFNQIEDPNVQSAAIQRIIETGAFSANPFEALEVAMSLESQKSRGTAISAAFGQLGSGAGGIALDLVVEHLTGMPSGIDRDFAINGFAHGLVGSAPDVALEWAASISDEQFKETVLRNVQRRISENELAGN